jgi:hypothetical protein
MSKFKPMLVSFDDKSFKEAQEKAKIVTGQSPTYKPSNSFPENHRVIEYKKLKKAKITG